MTGAKKPTVNFSRGEFGPELYGRVDIPQYEAGAKELTNFIIQRYGGVAFRPGFRFVGPILGDLDVTHILWPFQYSIAQSYVLVMGDEEMRVAALGGMIVEDDLEVLSATLEDGVIIEVTFHDWAVDDLIFLDGIEGMVEVNGCFATVTEVIDADHVRLDIDSTGYTALTGSSGTTRVGAPTPPPAPEPPPPVPAPPPDPPPTGGGGAGTGEDNTGGWKPYGDNGGYWHNADHL